MKTVVDYRSTIHTMNELNAAHSKDSSGVYYVHIYKGSQPDVWYYRWRYFHVHTDYGKSHQISREEAIVATLLGYPNWDDRELSEEETKKVWERMKSGEILYS